MVYITRLSLMLAFISGFFGLILLPFALITHVSILIHAAIAFGIAYAIALLIACGILIIQIYCIR